MKTGFFVLGFCGRKLSLRTSRESKAGRLFSCIVIAFLLASAVQPAAAQSTVQVSSYLYEDAGNQEYPLADHIENGTTEASTSSTYDPIYSNEQGGDDVMLYGYDAATPGAAHISANADFSRTLPRGSDTAGEQYGSDNNIIITITDLFITGPTLTVKTDFNFLVEGNSQASSSVYTAGTPGVSSRTSFGATVETTVQATSTIIGTGNYNVSSNNGGAEVIGAGGWLANFTGSNVVTSDSIVLPTNQGITLTINVGMLSDVGLYDVSSGQGLTSGNFGDTFSFATDRPVLDLPVGYTANSISGGIVANTYVATAVPEPGSWAMLLLGAGGLVFALRRRVLLA